MEDITKYTDTYEYIKVADGTGIVGISEEVSDKLGDIYLVELPQVGKEFRKGDEAGVIESVKTTADIYCPVSGKVTEINSEVEKSPELISKDPMGKGWLFKLKISNKDELEKLMDKNQFKKHINET